MKDDFLAALELELEIGAEIERSYLEERRDVAEIEGTERLVTAEARLGEKDFLTEFFRGVRGA